MPQKIGTNTPTRNRWTMMQFKDRTCCPAHEASMAHSTLLHQISNSCFVDKMPISVGVTITGFIVEWAYREFEPSKTSKFHHKQNSYDHQLKKSFMASYLLLKIKCMLNQWQRWMFLTKNWGRFCKWFVTFTPFLVSRPLKSGWQVWPLTQFYSVNISQARIDVS